MMNKSHTHITGSFQSAAKLNWASLLVSTILAVSLTLSSHAWEKGTQVQLKETTELKFKDTVQRKGEAGERFTVLHHDTGTKRVFVESKAQNGSVIALNAPEDAFEVDVVTSLARVESLLGTRNTQGAIDAATPLNAGSSRAPSVNGLVARLKELKDAETKLQAATTNLKRIPLHNGTETL